MNDFSPSCGDDYAPLKKADDEFEINTMRNLGIPIPEDNMGFEHDETIEENASPLDVQVGGSHYKDFAIQPVEFCQKNQLGYCESNIIKYVCRHKAKAGREDLEKVRHYVDLLIEMEYD